MAFSSRMVLARLQREGRPGIGVREQVESLVKQGYTNLKIIPLFAIGGEDFNKWNASIADLIPKFTSYRLGKPLLHSVERVQQVVEIMLRSFPERTNSELLLLMGHGSPHSEGKRFFEMAKELQSDDPLAFFGCIEGEPNLDAVMAAMQHHPNKTVVLAPFMMVTGGHAINDMAGSDPNSWQAKLEFAGYTVRIVQRSLLEVPEIVSLLLET